MCRHYPERYRHGFQINRILTIKTMETILNIYHGWVEYYSDSFCPQSDAIHQTANHICTLKGWDFERATKFVINLINR